MAEKDTNQLVFDVVRGKDTLTPLLKRINAVVRNTNREMRKMGGFGFGGTGRRADRETPAQASRAAVQDAAAQKRAVGAQRSVVREQGRLVDDQARLARRARAAGAPLGTTLPSVPRDVGTGRFTGRGGMIRGGGGRGGTRGVIRGGGGGYRGGGGGGGRIWDVSPAFAAAGGAVAGRFLPAGFGAVSGAALGGAAIVGGITAPLWAPLAAQGAVSDYQQQIVRLSTAVGRGKASPLWDSIAETSTVTRYSAQQAVDAGSFIANSLPKELRTIPEITKWTRRVMDLSGAYGQKNTDQASRYFGRAMQRGVTLELAETAQTLGFDVKSDLLEFLKSRGLFKDMTTDDFTKTFEQISAKGLMKGALARQFLAWQGDVRVKDAAKLQEGTLAASYSAMTGNWDILMTRIGQMGEATLGVTTLLQGFGSGLKSAAEFLDEFNRFQTHAAKAPSPGLSGGYAGGYFRLDADGVPIVPPRSTNPLDSYQPAEMHGPPAPGRDDIHSESKDIIIERLVGAINRLAGAIHSPQHAYGWNVGEGTP